jgi:hypothetical protein
MYLYTIYNSLCRRELYACFSGSPNKLPSRLAGGTMIIVTRKQTKRWILRIMITVDHVANISYKKMLYKNRDRFLLYYNCINSKEFCTVYQKFGIYCFPLTIYNLANNMSETNSVQNSRSGRRSRHRHHRRHRHYHYHYYEDNYRYPFLLAYLLTRRYYY